LAHSLLLLQIVPFNDSRNVLNEVLWTPVAGSAKESKSFRALAAQSAIHPNVEAVFTPLIAVIAGREHFWQARYYDFNVWTSKKRIEKLKYIHRYPVKRGLVEKPEDWQ
jgi:REP element-mobilizing transposase RayT